MLLLELLNNISGIELNKVFVDEFNRNTVEQQSNYAYFPVIFDGYKYNRNEVYNKLLEQNIVSRKYFYPITNSFDCYKDYKTANVTATPVAFDISNKVLTLPLYADLHLDIVERIVKIIIE